MHRTAFHVAEELGRKLKRFDNLSAESDSLSLEIDTLCKELAPAIDRPCVLSVGSIYDPILIDVSRSGNDGDIEVGLLTTISSPNLEFPEPFPAWTDQPLPIGIVAEAVCDESPSDGLNPTSGIYRDELDGLDGSDVDILLSSEETSLSRSASTDGEDRS